MSNICRSKVCSSGVPRLVQCIGKSRKYKILKEMIPSLSHVFVMMENRQKHGINGIREWGFSMATLEEVFITVVSDERSIEHLN